MRVLVTRAEPAASRTAARLRGLGHEPMLAPVATIRQTDEFPPLGQFDALIATSANAFVNPGTPGDPLRNWVSTPLFVVGDTTAEAARAAGFRDIRIGEGNAADLAELVVASLARGAFLLWITGEDRGETLTDALSEAGFSLAVWVRYAALPSEAWPTTAVHALRHGLLDAALHYSARASRLAVTLAARHGVAQGFAALTHVAISPQAAEPLRKAGMPRLRIAARPDEAAMIEALPASTPANRPLRPGPPPR